MIILNLFDFNKVDATIFSTKLMRRYNRHLLTGPTFQRSTKAVRSNILNLLTSIAIFLSIISLEGILKFTLEGQNAIRCYSKVQ